MGKIELQGIIVYAYHGAIPEEKVLGQRFEIDVMVEYDMQQIGESDDLTQGVNYAIIHNKLIEIVTGKPVNTLEHLVTLVNKRILQEFELVEKVTTRIKKASVPIAGTLHGVSVERTMQR